VSSLESTVSCALFESGKQHGKLENVDSLFGLNTLAAVMELEQLVAAAVVTLALSQSDCIEKVGTCLAVCLLSV
jgi:hypothetical protein